MLWKKHVQFLEKGDLNNFFLLDQMVGYKLGEFAPTRTFKGHIKTDKKIRR